MKKFGWLILIAVALSAGGPLLAHAQEEGLEPGVVRVCADPSNLPFSNRAGQGFENKLADLIARTLHRKLKYRWYNEARGGMSMPLGNDLCDIVMGYAEGSPQIEDTNPYYYTSYVLFYRADDKRLRGVKRLSDPRLHHMRIGVLARTPPATLLATNGLESSAVSFRTSVTEGAPSPAPKIFQEIAAGKLDAAILWGPIGGYYAQSAPVKLAMVPLVKENAGPATVYGITMGIRPNEPEWKHMLNKVIADNQREIDEILLGYNVPLLTPDGKLITSVEAAER